MAPRALGIAPSPGCVVLRAAFRVSSVAPGTPRSLDGPARSVKRGLLLLAAIIRQQQRAWIVPAGVFDQCSYPGIDRRMSRKQVRKALARIVDAQFHHGRGRAG